MLIDFFPSLCSPLVVSRCRHRDAPRRVAKVPDLGLEDWQVGYKRRESKSNSIKLSDELLRCLYMNGSHSHRTLVLNIIPQSL